MSQTKTTVITNPSSELAQLFDSLRRRQSETVTRLKGADVSKCDDIVLRAVTEEERKSLRITTYKYILP